MLEMSSTVKQVIANILKAVTVLGIDQENLIGMRVSTVNHILQGKLKHRNLK